MLKYFLVSYLVSKTFKAKHYTTVYCVEIMAISTGKNCKLDFDARSVLCFEMN